MALSFSVGVTCATLCRLNRPMRMIFRKRADAEPLIEVDDMIFMGNRPDAKCIFCYLQSLYNKLKKFEKLQKAEAEAEV